MLAVDLGLGREAFVVGLDAVGRVGEPDRAIGLHDHVVRAVEPFSLIALGQDRDRPVVLDPGDASGAVLAADHPALAVEGAAVGVGALSLR